MLPVNIYYNYNLSLSLSPLKMTVLPLPCFSADMPAGRWSYHCWSYWCSLLPLGWTVLRHILRWYSCSIVLQAGRLILLSGTGTRDKEHGRQGTNCTVSGPTEHNIYTKFWPHQKNPELKRNAVEYPPVHTKNSPNIR
jgi:hypothetical protein